MKLFDRFRAGLTRTREGLATRLTGLFRPGETRRLNDLMDELEEILRVAREELPTTEIAREGLELPF